MKDYKHIFFAANGFGPYICVFCSDEVTFEKVLVHHEDHDRSNNDISNLVAAHDTCHRSAHAIARKAWKNLHTPEARAAAAASITGRPQSEEHREAISRSLKGKTKSDAHRAALSDAAKRRNMTRGERGRFVG